MRVAPEIRFFTHVDVTGFCWLWNKALTRKGYAMFRYDPQKNKASAHRWVYELLVGPIAEGLVLDHLCRVRHCVNPDHLEPVTGKENTLRGNGDFNKYKTHCPQGHPYSGENLYEYRGKRSCKTCRNTRALEYQKRKKEKIG